MYAVVENALFVEDEEEKELSEIFVPISKEVAGLTGNMVSHMQLYLADVEAIIKPIAVIPDIGGPPNRYFFIKDREQWKLDFITFLERPKDIEEEISDYESDDSSADISDDGTQVEGQSEDEEETDDD